MKIGGGKEPDFIKSLYGLSLSEPSFRGWTFTFGEHKSRRTGEGIEFDEYKPYEPGEDISKLDVEATLRTGEKLIRQDLTEEKVRYVVVIDDSSSLGYYGMREVVFTALGCYLLSAVKDRDLVRTVVVGRKAFPEVSSPIYSSDDVLTLVLELWRQSDTKSRVGSKLISFSQEVSRALSLLNTRIVFISDFAFIDVGPVYGPGEGRIEFRGHGVLKQAVDNFIGDGQFCELAFVGVGANWKNFLPLRGFFPVRDAENRSSFLLHLNKRSARNFVDSQYQRERIWSEVARSLNVPMIWLHAGNNIVEELFGNIF